MQPAGPTAARRGAGHKALPRARSCLAAPTLASGEWSGSVGTRRRGVGRQGPPRHRRGPAWLLRASGIWRVEGVRLCLQGCGEWLDRMGED
jgi:hypothetical protein